MSRQSATLAWLAARAPQWRAMAASAADLRRRGYMPLEAAQRLLDGYRSLARDLATARREIPGARATLALESVYASYHALVNRAPRPTRASLLRMFRDEIPAVFASLRVPLAWVALLMAVSAWAGWWLVSTYPGLEGLIASPKMIEHVERGELWTDGLLNVTPSSVLSIRILSNNIAVSIMAFCAGVFFGLGTFYMIALNGLMLGAAFAFTHQYGLDGDLGRFVIAHGTVELSVICIAGAAGTALGESLIRPGELTRVVSFQRAVARLGKLLLLLALLLVGCGFIEGYVSPNPTVPVASRIVIGVAYWFVMVAALTGRLFGASRRRRSDAPLAAEAAVGLDDL